MSTNAVAQTALPKATPPRRRVWVYLFIVLFVVIFVGYLSLINSRDDFANNDYYRILHEASNKFNENLNQLYKMHVNGESVNSIRTQLPSYRRIYKTQTQKLTEESDIEFTFKLVGQEIKISNGTRFILN